jgi:hypothetical protein
MRLLVSLILLLALTGNARALDCATATSVIDKGLCATPALADREKLMEAQVAEVSKLSSPEERAMLDLVEKSWKDERIDNCGDLDGESLGECLAEGLDERIAEFMALPDSGPGAPSRMIPVFVVRPGDETHYTIYAQSFRFAEPKSEGEKLFNAHVAELLTKLPLAAIPKSEEGEVLESDTSMSIKYASPKLVAATAFWWHDNAEDGIGGLQSFTVNLETGKDVTIADLMTEAAAKELAKQCRERIIAAKKEQIDEFYDASKDAMLKDEVIAEHVATLSRWLITQDEIAILFDTGVIGETDEGDYECVFATAEVKALALPTAPLP